MYAHSCSLMCITVLFLLLCSRATLEAEDATVFKVLWNVPTIQCLKTYRMDFVQLLRNYGILVNNGDLFKGEINTIFYESQLGLYPHWDETTNLPVNGGIPQLGDLSAHLKKAEVDISAAIPDRLFNGLGIIDWESWRPVWDFNWGKLRKYQEESYKVVLNQHPNWKNVTLFRLAKEEWEKSAKDYFLETLRLAQRIRKDALWCYYLFPDCYNYKGANPQEFKCPPIVIKGNDQLKWLWDEITAVCPSLYIVEGYLDKYSFDQRTWYVNGRLQEALRVAPNSQLYPYVGYGITPGTMVPKDDFWRILAQVAAAGSSGAVIWGASASLKSKDNCQLLKTYVKDTLGPAVTTVKGNAERCARAVCNGKGRCTWPNDPNVVAWKLFIHTGKRPFPKDEITCRCTEGHQGKYCTVKERSAPNTKLLMNSIPSNSIRQFYLYLKNFFQSYF